MNKKVLVGVGFAAALFGLGAYLFVQKQPKKYIGPVEKVTIALGTGPVVSPVHIAFVKEYFKNEGLDVTLQQHSSGKDAFKAVLEGKADFGTAAETPIMHAVLDGEKVYIIATIESTEENKAIVARRDKGISTPSDLKGKKIGVPAGTNAEFFMNSLLITQRILADEVEVVDLQSNEIFDALMGGEVDAVSTWNPNIVRLQKELGDGGVTFYGEGIYKETFNIVALQDFVGGNPEISKKVIRALIAAEKLIMKKPGESRRIVADSTGMEEADLNELWNIYDFEVVLAQSLITTLEDQTRWAIKNSLTTATKVPNYLNFIYIDALEAIKPGAVTIIR